MSTDRTTPQKAFERRAENRVVFDSKNAARRADVENLDVTALQIDESPDDDCDPYNSTGQFLAKAFRQKNRRD